MQRKIVFILLCSMSQCVCVCVCVCSRAFACVRVCVRLWGGGLIDCPIFFARLAVKATLLQQLAGHMSAALNC